MVSELSEAPLAPFSDDSLHGSSVGSILVDGSVGEVGKLVVESLHRVLVSSEPDEAFFVNVDFEGTNGGEENVDPHVPFVASDEEGIREVSLEDTGRVIVELADVCEEEDASASTGVFGFTDPNFLLFLSSIFINKF